MWFYNKHGSKSGEYRQSCVYIKVHGYGSGVVYITVKYISGHCMCDTGKKDGMLVWGTANPEGLCESYNGLYFKTSDLEKTVKDIIGKPVKIEHKGVAVGSVVSAWVDRAGKLDLLLSIDSSVVEGSIISDLVDIGSCRDLSLGYSVKMQKSCIYEDKAGDKTVLEVSLVRKGAREKCHIHGYTRYSQKKPKTM